MMLALRRVLADALVRVDQPRDALETLEPLLEAGVRDVEVASLAASALAHQGRYAAASALLEKAVSLPGSDERLRVQFATMRIGAGQLDAGVQDLQGLLADDSTQNAAALALLVTYQREGRYKQAVELSERLLKTTPGNLSVRNLLGVAHYLSADYEAARNAFSACLEADDSFLPAALNLAKTDLALGRLDAARNRLVALLARRPGHAGIHLELSRLAFEENDRPRALTHALAAQEADDRSAKILRHTVGLYMKLDRADDADGLSAAVTRKYLDDLELQFVRVEVLMERGDAAAARMLLRRLLELVGSDDRWLIRIAAAQARLGDRGDAEFNLMQAAASAPDNLDARLGLIEMQLLQEKPAQALLSLEKAEKRFASEPRLALLRGEVHYALEQHAPALAAFDRSLALGGSSLAVVRGAHVLATQGKADSAIIRMERWLAERSNDALVLDAYAEFVLAAGQHEKAEAAYRALVQRFPGRAKLQNNYAYVANSLGRAEAVDHARRAVALEPTRARYQDTLGWILLGQGQAEEALGHLREASTRAWRDPEIRFHLAVCLRDLGRYEEALREVQEAIRLGPFNDLDTAKSMQITLQSVVSGLTNQDTGGV